MTGGALLVGGGVGAISTVRALRRAGYDGSITLVTDEEEAPYDRPPLSKQYLSGQMSTADLALLRPAEAADLDLCVRTATAAGSLDVGNRVVRFADGTDASYDALVIATGASARRLDVGSELLGVHYLRSRSDATSLRDSLVRGGRVVVVGAGFIGLEVAATASLAGAEVTVLEAADAPLTRVLGPDAGSRIAALHAGRGVDLRFGVKLLDIVGAGRVSEVLFSTADGFESIAADTVIIGVGTIPNTQWLEGAGVLLDNGVVCDSGGRSSSPGVFAVGDVSRWVNTLLGSHARAEQWQAATEQGGIAGANVAEYLGVSGALPAEWSSVPYFWSDQFEHKVQFCGVPGSTWRARETARGWVSCCADSESGPLRGVLAIDAPVAIARGRRLVASSTPWPEALTWLEAL